MRQALRGQRRARPARRRPRSSRGFSGPVRRSAGSSCPRHRFRRLLSRAHLRGNRPFVPWAPSYYSGRSTPAGAYFSHGKRRTQYPRQGAADQHRRRPVRDLRGDRRGTGSGPLVFPRRGRRLNRREDHLGLRHERVRRGLRDRETLREQAAPAVDAGPRVVPSPRAPGLLPRCEDAVLRVRRHGGRAKLVPRRGGARLAGDQVPGRAARQAVPDHHPRPHVGPGERTAAGSPRDARGESPLCRVLPQRKTGDADRLPHGRPDARPHGSGHDQVLGAGLRGAGQPPPEPAAGAAAPHQRGAVRPGWRGRGARGASPRDAGARSSAGASARSRA